jgi:hypothetical protein
MEFPMKTLDFFVTWLVASLLVTASAFAQSTPAQKQPIQEGGAWGGLSCNLVADAKDDPECAAYFKNKSQNLTPTPLQASEKATGQKK